MNALVRCNAQLLNPHERRRLHRGPIVIDSDILRSLNYWRAVHRAGDHALRQYAGHRAQALGGYPLARLRMIEAAIGCSLRARAAARAWNEALS